MSELGLEATLDQLTRPKRTVERFPLLLVANRLPRQVASMGWHVHWRPSSRAGGLSARSHPIWRPYAAALCARRPGAPEAQPPACADRPRALAPDPRPGRPPPRHVREDAARPRPDRRHS